MKKSMMILASVALGASMAAAENVESKNIVGFANVDVPAGAFRLVGANWQTMDGENSVSIQDLFNANELYMDEVTYENEKCDQIYVINGSTCEIYTYGYDYENSVYAWVDVFGVATKQFSRGDAFWFKRSSESPATTLTLAGQAPFDTSVAHTLPTGFSLFSYAFPNQTGFNDLGINAYMDEVTYENDKCDQIYVFNGTSYDVYTYGYDYENSVYAWLDNFGVATAGLPVGTSAWYKRSTEAGGNLNWTENKPY